MPSKYGICKVCGSVVYRVDDEPWKLAAQDDQEYLTLLKQGYFDDAPPLEDMPLIFCGCNE